MSAQEGAETAQPAPAYGGAAYRWYVCVILTLVYGCHSLDRVLPGILQEPVRREFHLSDSQLGTITGVAYALAFCVATVPVGWLIDRVNRRKFLAAILLVWSLFTALSGLARSYAMLLAARVGIGLFESGSASTAMSMIADIFPERQRGRALGLFYISQALGLLGSGVIGGVVAAHYGWRAAFFIAGVPGLILAATLILSVKEPRRGASDSVETVAPPARFHEVFQFLWRNPGLITLIFACSFLGTVSIALSAWLTSFFMRVHHLPLAQAGLVLGLGSGLGASLSPPLQGWLADHLQPRNPRWPLRIVMIASLLSMVFGFAMAFTGNVVLAIVCVILGDLCRVGYSPPTYSLYLSRTPPHLRGAAMSVMQLGTIIFGYGGGPLAVGLLSDLFGGASSLRYALASAIGFTGVVVALMWLSSHLLFGRRAKASAAALA
jgi:predicted MFS family arabinose efflux permease